MNNIVHFAAPTIVVEEITLLISPEELEAAIIDWLHISGHLRQDEEVMSVDLGIPLTESGFVEFDVTLERKEWTSWR